MSSTTTKKSAYIRTRIRPDVKRDAEVVFDRLGISATDAISVFLRQVALQDGLPFDVKIPNETTRKALLEDTLHAKRYVDTKTMLADLWPEKK